MRLESNIPGPLNSPPGAPPDRAHEYDTPLQLTPPRPNLSLSADGMRRGCDGRTTGNGLRRVQVRTALFSIAPLC